MSSDVENARGLMKAVERGLEEQCGLIDLSEAVREKCFGMPCE
jgi:hypothetical protein